jgi:hypothetical protein
MAIQSMILDPNAAAYTNDEIVAKINAATANITRASAVAAAARPIAALEVTGAMIAANAVTNAKLAAAAAKDNLDAIADTARGYIKTSPVTGQFRVIAIERKADGKLNAQYDDVAV